MNYWDLLKLMKYLNDEVINQLNKQQQEIINSNNELIMVEACPGAGKTYTIVKKIQKELKENNERGIIACSFTNEASKELEKRIARGIDVSNCFVGTIDSFVLTEIVMKFINRYLKLAYTNYRKVEIKEIVFPENRNRLVNDLTKFINRKEEIEDYYNNWLKNLIHGKYEISFPSYILATQIIDTEYFSGIYTQKYSTIYIDEAQDLNFYQHMFIKKLRSKTKIKVVMVGDSKQSIYQFRGANPCLFNKLEEQNYLRFNINISVRCHPSISYYANKLVGNDNFDLGAISKNNVCFIDEINIEFLQSLENGFFIICETNSLANSIYNQIKNHIDVYYVKPIIIETDDYNFNRDIIEEIIKYYFNHNNPLPKSVYIKEEFLKILQNTNIRIKNKDISIENEDIEEYIKKIMELIGISLSNETLKIIKEKLDDDIHKYYYLIVEKNNRIMTIHSSKGLENSNVIICLENSFNFDLEYKNKLFVAITRAIDNVYLYSTPQFTHIDKLKECLELYM